MKRYLGFALLVATRVVAQTHWNPDSTAFNYLSRGTNLQQWVASAGTKVEIDSLTYRSNRGSIKWTIPPNSGVAHLELKLVDLDLRDRVIYTSSRRSNNAAAIVAKVIARLNRIFLLPDPVYYNSADRHLPVEAWHLRGRYPASSPWGEAVAADLARVQCIRFQADNAGVEQILWVDEIKYTRPRGPACVIHFNHYRHTADSLLTPWLLASGYPANIDFTFEFAVKELAHNRADGGLWTRYIGLPRISELVRNHGWSTTHHGVFYRLLTDLTREERLQLYALEPFQEAGFETQWCFSFPSVQITSEIFAEIQNLNRFHSVRSQGAGKPPNELPINEPTQLVFHRPTSASAGPNLGGEPQTLSEMKARVDQYYHRKGLLVLDFGGIVTAPSPNYTDSEITMLEDAQALIRYADSLGFRFLTFADLFKPDPNYRQQLSINPDYARVEDNKTSTLSVLQNDLSPAYDKLRLAALGPAEFATAEISSDKEHVEYTPRPNFAGEDRFYYVATNGSLFDTAWVFVSVANSLEVDQNDPPAVFALRQNYPNPFFAHTLITYELTATASVTIQVYSSTGQSIATVVNGVKAPGIHRVRLAASDLAAGVYFYRLRLDDHWVTQRKMIHLKSP